MAEDGGKEVGGAGGGVGEQMAAEGLTHALGDVGSGIRGAIFCARANLCNMLSHRELLTMMRAQNIAPIHREAI